MSGSFSTFHITPLANDALKPQQPSLAINNIEQSSLQFALYGESWCWDSEYFPAVFNYQHQKWNRVVYKSYQMSFKSSNEQVSLIRVKSNTPKCWVFFEGTQQLQKYELAVDQGTTVQNIISEAIALIKTGASSFGLECPDSLFQLYASRKNGKKVSDLPSLEEKQAIMKTGLKFFILKDTAKSSKQTRLSNASTKSIQSEIKGAPPKKEVKAMKQSGCFCF